MPDNASNKNDSGSIVFLAGTTTVTLDTWYRVEARRSGTTVALGVNGTQEASATLSSGVGIFNPSATVYIGARYNLTGYLTGYISEFEIYKGVSYPFSNPSTPFPDEYVSVSGTTKDSSGTLASRLVRVYRQDTGAFVGEQLSNGTTGVYKITAANTGSTVTKHFAVMHDDDANPPTTTENALIYDNITPA
jgi:hypothetical protein